MNKKKITIIDYGCGHDELKRLLDKHRSKNGNWDVVVPNQ